MPITNITLRKNKTVEFKNQILDAVQAALIEAGVHPNDQFQRILELEPENFRFHPTFPDVQTSRTDDFVLIEILLGTGRSVKVKKKILIDIVTRLGACDFDPENIMIYFQDIPWENWSPAGGRMPHG